MNKKSISMVIALMLVGGTLVGCGAETPKKSEGSTEQVQQEESRNFVVGDTVETSKYVLTVNSMEVYVSQNEFMTAPEGKKYVKANVTIENIGDEDIAVSSMMCFKLFNENGESMNIALTDAESQLDGTVAVGRKFTGNVVYEVAEDQKEFELEVALELGSKPVYFKGTVE